MKEANTQSGLFAETESPAIESGGMDSVGLLGFDTAKVSPTKNNAPLAARMRPLKLDDFLGPDELVGASSMLRRAVESRQLPSMIFWGPPGCGKTSLALLLANATDYAFENLSAVMAGVKDIRAIVDRSKQRIEQGLRTLVFIDEVHRFNKSQQDALLPHVESGLFVLIGATTENPAFELNNALLSRSRIIVLEPIAQRRIAELLGKACKRDLALQNLEIDEAVIDAIAGQSNGDARRALNTLEALGEWAVASGSLTVSEPAVLKKLGVQALQYDKRGDHFFDQISALHKAIRGSSADAALYWLARMLEGGCDRVYLARRLLRMASEDIGLADPRALQVASDGWEAFHRLGSPEGELALAQVVVYLATAPKSNAVYTAFKAAMSAAKDHGAEPVPLHIRNAPTALAKSLDHGRDYRYAHDYSDAFVAGESYLPEALHGTRFYQPTEQGLEARIKSKLEQWSKLNEDSEFQRYK